MKRIVIFILSIISLNVFAQDLDSTFMKLFAKYKGEILFSREPVRLSTFDKSELEQQFNLEDDIYMHVFLEQSLASSYEIYGYKYDFLRHENNFNYAMQAYVDNTLKATWYYEFSREEFYKKVNFPVVLSTSNSYLQRDNSEFINQWANIVAQLKEGTHDVKIRIVLAFPSLIGNTLPVLSEGEFQLEVKEQYISEFLSSHRTGLPPATVINPELEEKIKEASRNNVPYSIPIRSFITDKNADWNNQLDENGFVVLRYIIASTVFRNTATGDCWVKTARYAQRHQGNGNFGPLIFSVMQPGYYDYKIPCNKAEK